MRTCCMSALICLLTITVFTALAFAAPTAQRPEAPAEDITMSRSNRNVVFKHSTHTKDDCVACHHLVNDKEDYRPCATPECHDVIGEGGKNKTERSYYQALHKGKGKHESCNACHRKAAAADAELKKRLPSGCKEKSCHPNA